MTDKQLYTIECKRDHRLTTLYNDVMGVFEAYDTLRVIKTYNGPLCQLLLTKDMTDNMIVEKIFNFL